MAMTQKQIETDFTPEQLASILQIVENYKAGKATTYTIDQIQAELAQQRKNLNAKGL